MKSTAAVVVLGLGLLAGCGGAGGGPRDNAEGGTAPITAGTPGVSGSAGTPVTAGMPSGGNVSVGGMGGAGGAPDMGPRCGTQWVAGTTYAEGAIVLFMGSYYIATHENPGYDPTISTYFWSSYSCGSQGGGGNMGGGGAPTGESSFDDIVSEDLFHQMFPGRDNFYTYAGLVDATRRYSAFAGTGTMDERKREAAAFLANVARETGELRYIEQIAKDVYCQPSGGCDCAAGKSYYGRGPLQISWNYNYCAAGDALQYDLRANPELVATNPTVAWATGVWFWMTQAGAGSTTPHFAISNGKGFGETIRAINGSVECNGGSSEGVNSRVDFYQRFCQLLGVDPGANLTC